LSSANLSVKATGSTTLKCSWAYYGIPAGHQFCLYMKKTGSPSTPPTIFYPAGTRSGSNTFSGLTSGANYTFYCYDYIDSSHYTELYRVSKTMSYSPPPPPPPKTSGTLSANATSPTTVSLNYSYKNGSSVTLFRDSDLVITFGSGTNSGVYEDTVDPDTVYVYTLRNGATIGSKLLASATIGTPPLPAEGTLSGQVIDSATIDLTYSFSYGTNVSLFRGTTKVTTFGSGSGSGTYRNGDLSPDTSYTYYLRDGSAVEDTLLATVTKKTLKEARKAIIERGKILPLSSQITIFDSTLTCLGIIEKYTYTYWNFKYRSVGDFKLIINRYLPKTEYLIKGNLLALYVAGYYRAGIIEYKGIKLDEGGKITEDYEITGRLLGGLLSERLALHITDSGTGYDSQNTLASTAMRHYVNVNCMDAINTDRNYPLLYLEDPDPEAGGNIKYDARFQYISELNEEICLASGLGWEIVLDPINKKMIFMIIEGLDRSFGNGVNSPITFSPKFENIRFINYVDSNINSKNVAYVAGQGEADLRDVDEVAYLGASYTGMARREIFIDARDADATDKMLQRGNERLVELGETKIIEIENLASGPFSYGKDFYLGDIVTAEHPDIVSANVRVIEAIIEIDSERLIQNSLIFGKSFPDLINIKSKDTLPEIRR